MKGKWEHGRKICTSCSYFRGFSRAVVISSSQPEQHFPCGAIVLMSISRPQHLVAQTDCAQSRERLCGEGHLPARLQARSCGGVSRSTNELLLWLISHAAQAGGTSIDGVCWGPGSGTAHRPFSADTQTPREEAGSRERCTHCSIPRHRSWAGAEARGMAIFSGQPSTGHSGHTGAAAAGRHSACHPSSWGGMEHQQPGPLLPTQWAFHTAWLDTDP